MEKRRIISMILASNILLNSYTLKKVNADILDNSIINNIIEKFTKCYNLKDEYKKKSGIYLEKENEKVEVLDETKELGLIKRDTTLYSNPTTLSLDIGTLNIYDSAYRIFSLSNGFTLVETTNELVGFIKTEDIDYLGFEEERPVDIHYKNDIVITTTAINFRTGPGLEYNAFRVIEEKMELQVLGETENGWLLVCLNGEIGYVYKMYTTSLKEKIQEKYPAVIFDDFSLEKVVIVKTGVNFRTEPNTESPIIREFSKSETMKVLGEYNDWYFGFTDDYEIGFVYKPLTTEMHGYGVDIDILTQRMRMYNENQLLYYTRVKTGKDETPSDEGTYAVYYMGKNQEILPGTVVNYWMAYNGGEGIHDLTNCKAYGDDDYHTSGSHGCIRTPLENVSKIYKKAYVGLPVIVHK